MIETRANGCELRCSRRIPPASSNGIPPVAAAPSLTEQGTCCRAAALSPATAAATSTNEPMPRRHRRPPPPLQPRIHVLGSVSSNGLCTAQSIHIHLLLLSSQSGVSNALSTYLLLLYTQYAVGHLDGVHVGIQVVAAYVEKATFEGGSPHFGLKRLNQACFHLGFDTLNLHRPTT